MGDHPRLLPLYLRLTQEGIDRRISVDTQLVIEGFPRSGNTFTAAAIAHAQPQPLAMSTHAHCVANVEVAVARDLPTLVVVREPVDCLASYLVWDPRIGVKTVLWEYIHYHKGILPLARSVTVATFDEVVEELPAVVARLNDRFGTHLTLPPNTAEFTAEVDALVRARHRAVHPNKAPERVTPVPHEAREAEAGEWRERLTAPTWSRPLAEARRLHDRLAALAVR